MKKKTINKLTNIFGFLFWVAIFFVKYIVDENRLAAMLLLFFLGVTLVFFKNTDLIALTKRFFSKFKS